jgi:suppressor of tumorigenicity protein 13
MQQVCEDVIIPCLEKDSYMSDNALIFFTATWCGPCSRVKPAFLELCRKLNSTNIFICDVDKCDALHDQFSVKSLPTFVFLENGKELPDRRVEGTDLIAVYKNMSQHFGVGISTSEMLNTF